MAGNKHNREKDLARALERLKLSGLKITKPRENVLRFIVSMHEPFNAETLSIKIVEKWGARNKMDLVTIYRCLAKFSEIGLLTTHDFGDGSVRYELIDEDGGHHHHLICKKCHSVEALKSCPVPDQDQMLKKFRYKNISHKLEFFGICPTCA